MRRKPLTRKPEEICDLCERAQECPRSKEYIHLCLLREYQSHNAYYLDTAPPYPFTPEETGGEQPVCIICQRNPQESGPYCLTCEKETLVAEQFSA